MGCMGWDGMARHGNEMASPSIQVDPVILYEAKLAPNSMLPGERRAVAMVAGYLEPSPPPLFEKNAASRCAHVCWGAQFAQ